MTKILITGDWHCGSSFGLTPPEFHSGPYRDLQEKLWNFWEKVCTQAYDAVILMGDLVDGGIDVIDHVSLDRREQLRMVQEAIKKLVTEKIRIITGTPLHVNGVTEFEMFLKDSMGIRVMHEGRFQIEDVFVHTRHKGKDSQTPYGFEGMLLKEAYRQKNLDGYFGSIPPQLVIRAHVHRYGFVQSQHVSALSIPCLQYPLSGFGSTVSKWGYDMGVVQLTIDGSRIFPEPVRIKLGGLEEFSYERL